MNLVEIIERIKGLHGFTKDKELADFLGLSEQDFNNRKKRGTLLRLILDWSINESMNLNWLLRGKETPTGGISLDRLPRPYCTFVQNLAEAPRDVKTEEFISIPLVSGEIAAGEPVISPDKIEGWMIIHVSQVGRKTNLVAIRVRDEKDDKTGRSMDPIIRPGSMVAIDKNDIDLPKDHKLTKKRIYAVRKDGGCTLKFVQRAGDTLILIPANREVADIESVDLCTAVDPIVGRAIWSWQTL